MRTVGQKRHGAIDKSADDLHAHEDGGNDRRQFRAGFRTGMAMPQKHVIAGPDSMIVWLFSITVVAVFMAVIVVMMMVIVMAVMAVMAVIMGMIVTANCVVMCHDHSLACWRCKIS
jgi:hypothetical protein